jgi:hypothetical protein
VPELVGWQDTKALLNDVVGISPLVGYLKRYFLTETKCRLTENRLSTNIDFEYADLKLKRKRQCVAKKLHLTN